MLALSVEPQATVELNKGASGITLYVRDSLIYRGRFAQSDGTGQGFLLGYTGENTTYLEAQLEGAVVAPRSTLVLGAGSERVFTGEFAARNIEVRPDVRVQHLAYGCEQSTTAR